MADPQKPAPSPITVALSWDTGRRLRAQADSQELLIDGDRSAGMSPVQLLACGLAGCMALDVVHILERGRHEIAGLSVRLDGERASGTPAYYTRIRLHFLVAGDPPVEAVERALQLSRDTYCSVWHSLRQDIELITTCEIAGG